MTCRFSPCCLIQCCTEWSGACFGSCPRNFKCKTLPVRHIIRYFWKCNLSLGRFSRIKKKKIVAALCCFVLPVHCYLFSHSGYQTTEAQSHLVVPSSGKVINPWKKKTKPKQLKVLSQAISCENLQLTNNGASWTCSEAGTKSYALENTPMFQNCEYCNNCKIYHWKKPNHDTTNPETHSQESLYVN